MTQVSNATFKSDTATLYADNTSGQISPADLRAQMDNIADSVPFKTTGKSTAPTANDDVDNTGGNGAFIVGDIWVDETNDKLYICLNNSSGAAIWTELSQLNDLVEDTTPQLGGNLDFNGNIATSFESTGIDDNATSTAITIDASENVGIGTTSPIYRLVVSVGGADGMEYGPGYTSGANLTQHYNRSTSSYLRSDVIASAHTWQISGTERMRLDSSGKLGIGTISPLGKLDVSDGSNPLSFDSSTYNEIQSYNRPLLINRQGNNVGIGTSSPGATLDVVGGSTLLRLYDGTNNATAKVSQSGEVITISHAGVASGGLAFATGSGALGTERMRIDSSGNVGIGTTSPAVKLNVVSGSSDHIRLEGTSGDTYGLWVSPTGTSLTVGSWGNGARINLFDSSEVITFGTGASSAERMRIDSTGRVLIGATSLTGSERLLVAGASSEVAVNATSGVGGVRFREAGTERAKIGTLGGSNGMLFEVGGSEALRINSSSDLLVGTTSATYTTAGRGLIELNGSSTALTALKVGNTVKSYWYANGTNVEFLAADGGSLLFGTGTGTEKVRIDTAGNVGIGTSSPSSTAGVATVVHVEDATAGYKAYGTTGSVGVELYTGASLGYLGTTTNHAFAFYTNNAERGRILSNGTLVWGGTSEGASGTVNINPSGYVWARNASTAGYYDRTDSDGDVVIYRRNAVPVGSVSVTGTTTTYNTSSDERLKENIADAQNSNVIIDAIKVREFDWKFDGSHQRYGFIAQELEQIFPEAVHTDDSEDEMKSVDYSVLVPLLLKEIQDLRKRVSDLEN